MRYNEYDEYYQTNHEIAEICLKAIAKELVWVSDLIYDTELQNKADTAFDRIKKCEETKEILTLVSKML